MAIDVRGTRGEATDTSGCTVYDISNKERLGSTMLEQVQTMVKGVETLLKDGAPTTQTAEIAYASDSIEPERKSFNENWDYDY